MWSKLLNKKVPNNFLFFCTYNKIRRIKVQTILHKITEVRSNITQQFFQLYSKLVLAKQSHKFDNLTGDKVMLKWGGFSLKTSLNLLFEGNKELRINTVITPRIPLILVTCWSTCWWLPPVYQEVERSPAPPLSPLCYLPFLLLLYL